MCLKKLFGNKLKELRLKKGYTQEAFAELVGYETNSIAQVEMGRKGVSFTTLELFAEKLNVDYLELFDFNETKTETSLIKKANFLLKQLDKQALEHQISQIEAFVNYSSKNQNNI